MKKNTCLLVLSMVLGFISCNKEDDSKYADYVVARPLTMTVAEFKSSVEVVPSIPINESGKIYAYGDYIFVNDKYKGVHVIDNSNPSAPRKVSFIKIAGNVDISIKDNYLYADSITDLIVMDISDVNNIRIVNRLEDVLVDNVIWPVEADIFEGGGYDYNTEILVGWELTTERRLISEFSGRFGGDVILEAANSDSTVGQGGSLARFKIVDNYLYVVDSHSINVFEISDLEAPKNLDDVFAGFDIETIFSNGQHLFLGSRSGMYIFDLATPASPEFVSEFQHGTACDPVVVDGDYAYVTLRGGNNCGATESGLFIVDISDIANPVLAKSYGLDEPYGLGIKDEKLFICDGSSGLRVYDKTDINNLTELNHFEDIITFDVIPMENRLLMVGDEVLYQYEYLNNDIALISTLELQ